MILGIGLYQVAASSTHEPVARAREFEHPSLNPWLAPQARVFRDRAVLNHLIGWRVQGGPICFGQRPESILQGWLPTLR